ncbi:hypothetical protein KQI63_08970 [bacterium]|nr:hypothetical protein [bacterium]
MRQRVIVFSLFFVFLFAAANASATTLDGNKYGVGLQVVDGGASGLAMTIDLKNSPASIQPILGFNDFPALAGRLRYAFIQKRYLDGYGYGMLGTSNAEPLMAGAGVGIEWDWRMLDRSLPPVSFSFDIGFNTDRLGYGLGIHYTF